jgi:hypothetical protein
MVNRTTCESPNGEVVCNPIEGEHQWQQNAELEFKTFVKQTYDELYKIKTMCLGG